MIEKYDGIKELAICIVTQMVKDYYKCLVDLKKDNFKTTRDKLNAIVAVKDYEDFFKSDRFLLYTKFPGEKIIRIVRERVNDETN